MKSKKQKMIDFLLKNANPSIKLRVKKEVLNSLTKEEAEMYQEQIMKEPIIQKIIVCQRENGWIGDGLHGYLDSQEGGTKYLAEKGIDKNTPVLKRAMEAFATIPLDDKSYTKIGRIIDVFKYPAIGNELIRGACIARARYDDIIDIKPLIRLSLDSFKRVLEVDSILDVSRPIQGGKKLVFKENEKWPCRYHLDILAHTDSWKNENNIKIIADSVAKMMKTDQPELVNLIPQVWIGHPIGTLGAFPAQGLSVMCTGIFPFPITHPQGKSLDYNVEYIEWFARCGIVPHIPALQKVVNEIMDYVDDDGICHLPVKYVDLYKGWGPYGGLQLETDWKSKTRKACDITFRALLILHYADNNP
ncbi:hypothetical protein [Clostridium thermosuccinogenes]|uniref:hypothetical protein n=1 Tax=Clostridium thermosuccinogenes TaxID=84032 RepID=UPI000CCC1646|nr:hypothetical protein [Pseudoclostridium thermosuccinogenes]PNT92087.1 hypothetical protein CDQ83_00425 [Pseudoclostridium thermosuccinogenes]